MKKAQYTKYSAFFITFSEPQSSAQTTKKEFLEVAYEFREGQDPPLQKGGVGLYLSIGNDMAVRDRSIIGIFDLDNTSTSKRTREFLEKAEQNGEVVPCDELPKSFVLTSEYGFSRIRLTSLSAATLEKRLK